jgi:hypothetical protein
MVELERRMRAIENAETPQIARVATEPYRSTSENCKPCCPILSIILIVLIRFQL